MSWANVHINGYSLPREEIPLDELYGAHDPIVAVYCDGGCIGHNPSAEGGAWAWCHVNGRNIGILESSGLLLPTEAWPIITNNYSEYVAMLRCLEALPDRWSGLVCSDSAVTIGRFSLGWATAGIPNSLVNKTAACLARLGKLEYELLDGHPSKEQLRERKGKRGNRVSIHNVWCDLACRKEVAKYHDKLEVQHGGI